MPGYYTFLVALAFLPAAFLFSRVQQYVNWRAFGVTALYLLVTSMAWEATLALPRHWWGYKPSAMLGIWVTAWTQDPTWPFPLEAVFVWVASPFAIVLTYEFVKLWNTEPTRRSRPMCTRRFGNRLRTSLQWTLQRATNAEMN